MSRFLQLRATIAPALTRQRHVSGRRIPVQHPLMSYEMNLYLLFIAWSCDCHTSRGSIGVGASCSIRAHPCSEVGQTGRQSHCPALQSTRLSHAGEPRIIIYVYIQIKYMHM